MRPFYFRCVDPTSPNHGDYAFPTWRGVHKLTFDERANLESIGYPVDKVLTGGPFARLVQTYGGWEQTGS